jgi:FkbM family methyltransferase
MLSSSAVFWWRSSLSAGNKHFAKALLTFAAPLKSLRRVPLLGNWLGRVGDKVVPRDTLIWAQIQRGHAAGLWIQVSPRTGKELLHGDGEPEIQDAISSQVKPGMTFYDVGANIGFFSLLAARLTGPTGCVFAFEADPEIASRLRQNAGRNEFGWVSVTEAAVWSEPRSIFFRRSDPRTSPDRGLGHVVEMAGVDTIGVQAISLDEFARFAPPPDFIKCDVEGAEMEVFRGARRLLAESRPRILCEVHSDAIRQALLVELSDAQYSCADCGQRHILALPS